MKVTVVMPVFNGEKFIELAIKSVVNQTYDNIQFILVDGGSTDNTMDIVEKYSKYFFKIISEKDNGMYDAINKGFSYAEGEMMLWLNSDDYLFPNAIKTAVEVMKKYKHIKWLKGRNVCLDEENRIRKIAVFKSYYRNFIKKGFYRGNGLGYIMQETTFWHRDLYKKSGGYLNTDYKLASDFELWCRFANYEKLYSLNTLMGAFRQHSNQLSSNIDSYEYECNQMYRLNFKFIFKLIKFPIYLIAMVDKRNKIYIKRDSTIAKVENFGVFQ